MAIDEKIISLMHVITSRDVVSVTILGGSNIETKESSLKC